MNWLIASNLGLLVALTTLGVVVLSLARQIGVLHERTSPAGISPRQLRQGQPPDPLALTLTSVTGASTALADLAQGRGLAILFVGSDCPICKALLPVFEPALAHLNLPTCYAGGNEPVDVQARYATENALDPERCFVGVDLAAALNVMLTPTLVVVDSNGEVVFRETLRGPGHLHRAVAGLNRARRVPSAPEPESS
ncbi:MAG: hypothetical protein OXU72_14610 [Gammaproteobacteria bacterium]|nr:hypothetical protein [Gammaproteobacteria bacterium]